MPEVLPHYVLCLLRSGVCWWLAGAVVAFKVSPPLSSRSPIPPTMEVLAALNRILLFGGDAVEVSSCCERIEELLADSSFEPSSVPLSALADAAQVLFNDGAQNGALAKALCGLISACCVGDSPVTKEFLMVDCNIVEVVDVLLGTISGPAPGAPTPIATSTVSLGYHLLDLVATLTYNSGDLRSAMRPVAGKLPSLLRELIGSICRLSEGNGLEARYNRGGTSQSVEDGVVVVSGLGGDVVRSLRAHIDALFACLTTITLLCVGDVSNSTTFLREDVFAVVVDLYKVISSSAAPLPTNKSPSALPPAQVPPTFPRRALSEESKRTLLQWCEQALRNLTLGAVSALRMTSPTDPLPTSLEDALGMLRPGGALPVFGRMGENVDLDALKWTLQQAYRMAVRR